MSVTIVVYDVNIYMLIMSHNAMASVKLTFMALKTQMRTGNVTKYSLVF